MRREKPLADRITVERDDHVLLIGVNRPDKRNAFDLSTIEQLAEAYDRLGAERELRAGVLFGHGDHFSAGLDLGEVGPAVADRTRLPAQGAMTRSACGASRYPSRSLWRYRESRLRYRSSSPSLRT